MRAKKRNLNKEEVSRIQQFCYIYYSRLNLGWLEGYSQWYQSILDFGFLLYIQKSSTV